MHRVKWEYILCDVCSVQCTQNTELHLRNNYPIDFLACHGMQRWLGKVLLWKRGEPACLTASRMSSLFHFLGRPLLPSCWGLALNWLISGFLKFPIARAQTFLIVLVHRLNSRATAVMVPWANLPSLPWFCNSHNNLETIWLRSFFVSFFFLLGSWTGLGWGSASGGSIVATYKQNTDNGRCWRVLQ